VRAGVHAFACCQIRGEQLPGPKPIVLDIAFHQAETRRLHYASRQSIVVVRFDRGALWPRASDVMT